MKLMRTCLHCMYDSRKTYIRTLIEIACRFTNKRVSQNKKFCSMSDVSESLTCTRTVDKQIVYQILICNRLKEKIRFFVRQ